MRLLCYKILFVRCPTKPEIHLKGNCEAATSGRTLRIGLWTLGRPYKTGTNGNQSFCGELRKGSNLFHKDLDKNLL